MRDTTIDLMMRYTLGLSSDWQVDQMVMDTEGQRVDVYLSHSGKHLVCPETGERGRLYDHRRTRSWRHLDWFQCKCVVHCRVPRVQSSAGIKTIQIPWADASSRVTYSLERWAIDLLKATKNQTKTAKLLRCGFNQLNRIMHRSVERGLHRRSLKEIQHVSVDEKALKRNHVYATIVSTRGVVIDVGEGRTKKGTIALLERIFAEIKGVVETITTDMWTAYITAVEAVFPNGTLIHDRFHLIQYLNTAINRVRRREVKDHPELKGTRYVLLKNESNRTQKQDEVFKVIQESNLQVSLAWRLREEFKGIFECHSFAEAKTYFELWLTSVQDAAVTEVVKIAEMFERHFDGVCPATIKFFLDDNSFEKESFTHTSSMQQNV